MSAADARKTYSIRLSDDDCAMLPPAESISESVRRAILLASERRRHEVELAELRGAITDLDARIDALLSERRASPDEAGRDSITDAKLDAFLDEVERTNLFAKLERAQAFHAEHFANSTAGFRRIVAIEALAEAILAGLVSENRSDAALRELAAASERSLLKEHWEEFAIIADRMHDAVYGAPQADPSPAEATATAAE